ncbi:EamA family transporter [soil metagenome]
MLWGTTGTAASFLPTSVSPLATGAATMAIGGILLFAVFATPSIAALRANVTRHWLALGALGVVVYPLAFYSAMDLAGVAIGNIVALGSAPVFAALLEWLFERRRPGIRWVVSTAIAVLGIVLLASLGREQADGAGGGMTAGVLLGLLAGLAYAIYTYASSRAMAAGAQPLGAMGGMFGLGAVPLLLVLILLGGALVQSPSSLAVIAYLAIGPMFLAYVLFGLGLRTIRSSTATTITLLEPIVATLLAVFVVGERFGPFGWIGIALVLVGVAVTATARQSGRQSLSP